MQFTELTVEEMRHILMTMNSYSDHDCQVCHSARAKLEVIIKTHVPMNLQLLGVCEIERTGPSYEKEEEQTTERSC